MSDYIINAAPMVIDLGTQDLSTVAPARVPEAIPQHCPKFFLYTQQGPVTPQLVSGAELANMFGATSLDLRSPYANHATVFANECIANGGTIMVQRILPSDIGPNSSIVLYLDVLATTVSTYQKDPTGAVMTDVGGNPVVLSTTPGYKVKWVLGTHATVADLNTHFGTLATAPGDQTVTVGGTTTQSIRYPIFEFMVSSQGLNGNNLGLRFWAPTLPQAGQMPVNMMQALRAYPYRFSMISRVNATSSPTVTPTILGDQSIQTVLLPGAIDPTTNMQLYAGDVLLNSYQNVNDPTYPPVFGNFSKMSVYQANIDFLLGQFYTSELAVSDAFTDITSNPDDKYLINIASFVSSQNSPYNSIKVVSGSNSVAMSQYTNLFAQSGSDGTMSDANFATSVVTAMAAYLDPNSPVQDDATNVESIFYDSGFPLATKQALCNAIAVRKDTFVALTTYDVNGPVLSEAEENSVAISLLTRLQMFPESSYFGTPVMRGMIIGRSGTLLNTLYKKQLPISLEVAIKATQYMGAANGKWKNGFNFDGAPGSVLQYMVAPSITWVPKTVRNKDWSVGLNWVQAYDRRSYFFPALKTAYNNDTSVLNSFTVAMAICTLNKIAHAAWREFSGVDHLSNAQLVDRVNSYVNQRVQGIFDNRYIIVPQAVITNSDLANGFSWTLPISIYTPNMKTVMTTYIQAKRISAYTGK